MAGVCKIEIAETEEELKKLLSQQRTGYRKERLQQLYLLKTKKAQSVTEAASLLGRNRVTLQDWLQKYREGGLEELLCKKVSTGRPREIPSSLEKALENELKCPEGFNIYGEICQWLEERLGREVKYKTVHQLVHYRLKASPKIARPKSQQQIPERLEAFKKTALLN
jgi:transposase